MQVRHKAKLALTITSFDKSVPQVVSQNFIPSVALDILRGDRLGERSTLERQVKELSSTPRKTSHRNDLIICVKKPKTGYTTNVKSKTKIGAMNCHLLYSRKSIHK